MSTQTVKVPDLGGHAEVSVIEINVAVGDQITAEQTLITLETDKATMEVPAPNAGRVTQILLKEGAQVAEGAEILVLESASPVEEVEKASAPSASPAASTPATPAASAPAGRQAIEVPDLGGHEAVEIIEVLVQVGDQVQAEDTLITLETDKATMDIPAPQAGQVVEFSVKVGDKVSTGDILGYLSQAAEAPASDTPVAAANTPAAPSASPTAPSRQAVQVPDLSGHADVPVIEINAQVGDQLKAEDALITLETDKATMEIPCPQAGVLVELCIKEGDTVNVGDVIAYLETQVAETRPTEPAAVASSAPTNPAPTKAPVAAPASAPTAKKSRVHAGPAVRLLAREFGVDLADVTGSGPKNRILKEDVQAYVKAVLQQSKQAPKAASTASPQGAGIPPIPTPDFSQFGPIEEKPMGRLLKAGAVNLHRSWLNVPHVTQFDQADISGLEDFRKSMKAEAERQGAKLTPLPFILKACAYALRAYPQFNVSLGAGGDTLIWKDYVNIGFAVDTPDGLLVPVLKDVDKKGIIELAKESSDLAARAQKKQLKPLDMQGGCFTISSLGSIGGTAFTPIVNAPEVAILGVSKASMQPVWDGKAFQPRLMLPLSLSYDHRAINGADAARFAALVANLLGDIRRLLM
ncbi:pyruvate dehydrogenase E2 component (dihydrolipoamide acetyltransferase) [Allopseudospirillum japonicum]|uniref:Acetyltransferase component of pyruvate dehydrogenase complex n=1 Tax=Allopseudospirillum japonicum TaxID=64971 RepID=A0A1H6TVN1_9GAMM|nr:dihydrolipoyllysine-residue acetyltransferase [Allopseudospirillum japonicum]SEI79802.1 pyruvate dehydrogenase E2 component (dihydrolipoamide acetyltransferase) [Allopseudospirillum japonicum]